MKSSFRKVLSAALVVLMLITACPANVSAASKFSELSSVSQQTSKTKKKMQLKKSKVTLTVGFTFKQKLIAKNGKAVAGKKVKWKSANKKVATVTDTGTVVAKKAGKTKVIAKYKGKKYTFNVTVKKPVIAYKTKNLKVGDTFKQSLKTAAGKKISNKKIIWNTSNTSIATVSGVGLVTAKKAGTATITATFKGKQYKSTVKVTSGSSNSSGKTDFDGIPYLSFNNAGLLLIVGNKKKISCDHDPASAVVSWTSNNSSVASVDSNGNVTANKPGTAVITATMKYGGKTYTDKCNVKVEYQSATMANGFTTYRSTNKYVQSFNDYCQGAMRLTELKNDKEEFSYSLSDIPLIQKYVDLLNSPGSNLQLTGEYYSSDKFFSYGFTYTGTEDIVPEYTLQYSDDKETKYAVLLYVVHGDFESSRRLRIYTSDGLEFGDLGFRADGTKESDLPSGPSTAASLLRNGTRYMTDDNRLSVNAGQTSVYRNGEKINATVTTEGTSTGGYAYKVKYQSGGEKTFKFSFPLNENNTGVIKEIGVLSDTFDYASSYEEKFPDFIYYNGGWKEPVLSAGEIDDVTIRVFFQDDYRLIYYVYVDTETYDNEAEIEIFGCLDILALKDEELKVKRAEEKKAREEELKKRKEEEEKKQQQQNSSSGSSGGSSGGSSIVTPGFNNSDSRCITCGGSGRRRCTVCGGTGYTSNYVSSPNYSGSSLGSSGFVTKPCPSFSCNGGWVNCTMCGGDGRR